MPTPRAMFRIVSVTCLLTGKAFRLIIAPDYYMCLMLSGFAYVYIRMGFNASNNLYYYRYCGCPACVCLCLFVRVHHDTENSFSYILYHRDFC